MLGSRDLSLWLRCLADDPAGAPVPHRAPVSLSHGAWIRSVESGAGHVSYVRVAPCAGCGAPINDCPPGMSSCMPDPMSVVHEVCSWGCAIKVIDTLRQFEEMTL